MEESDYEYYFVNVKSKILFFSVRVKCNFSFSYCLLLSNSYEC